MNQTLLPTIYEQYSSPAMRIAYRILGSQDAAADAVQEGLIKAHEALVRFEEGSLRAWFMRIVTNTAIDHLRREKRRKLASLDQLMEESAEEPVATLPNHALPMEQQFLQTESYQTLLEVIEQLPDCYRLVLQRIDVEGYHYEEVAEQLQLPMGTVKSRLYRARVIVRDQLVESGIVA